MRKAEVAYGQIISELLQNCRLGLTCNFAKLLLHNKDNSLSGSIVDSVLETDKFFGFPRPPQWPANPERTISPISHID